jgi:hypothetical protein
MEDPLRTAERAIVQALTAAGWSQSQVTFPDRFEIATDDLIIRVERNPGYVPSRIPTRAEVERSQGPPRWRRRTRP